MNDTVSSRFSDGQSKDSFNTHMHADTWVSLECVAYHIVVGLTDDSGVKTFGGAFQCSRLWLVWRLVYTERKESKNNSKTSWT